MCNLYSLTKGQSHGPRLASRARMTLSLKFRFRRWTLAAITRTPAFLKATSVVSVLVKGWRGPIFAGRG